MYSQLSATQQAVLDSGDCPHCHQHSTIIEIWTRNGPTVKCSSCGKKVYRPRGRAVAKGGNVTSGAGQSQQQGQGEVIQPAGSESGQFGQSGSQESGQCKDSHSPDGKHIPSQVTNGRTCAACGESLQQSSSQSQQPSQTVQQAAGKQLSQAAAQALAKIEDAVKQEMQKRLDAALKQMEKEKQEASEQLQEQLQQEVEALRPKEVIVKSTKEDGTQQTVSVPGAHKLLAEILKLIGYGIRNILLVGPSGSGKSTLARQIALALNVPYGMLPWSGDTTPGSVLGRPSPDGTSFNPSPWLQLYTTPSVFNHDEIDGADPNVPICMNAAIENGEIFLPSGHFVRHKDHIVIATANTWGIGADMLYCGRNQLDAAVRDRFVGGAFMVDYDASLEMQLVPESQYREAFWEIRSKIFEHKLRRVWGTRTLVRGALLVRGGESLGYTFKRLTEGFSPDELAKIGVA